MRATNFAGALLLAAAAAASGSEHTRALDGESFTEDLLVKPLNDGKVLLHFDFNFERSQPTNDTAHHYHLFPRQIGEIAQRYSLDDLQLSFTQANWQEKWGDPATNLHGVGAEMRATIGGPQESQAERWRGATNALSGVFCASLNFIDDTNTRQIRVDRQGSGQRMSGYLPRENVCTENLTPWIKQLPCQAMSGLGVLLNPHRLYNMHFHSMGIALQPTSKGLSYRQYLSVVLDPRTFGLQSTDWSLTALLDRPLSACPAAKRSTVRVIAKPGDQLRLSPKPTSTEKWADAGDGLEAHVFDIGRTAGRQVVNDIGLQRANSKARAELPRIGLRRFVTGRSSGSMSGGVEALISNRGDAPVRVRYIDTLPWYLRVYLHTLTINRVSSDALAGGEKQRVEPESIGLVPSVDRGRPTTVDVVLELPAQSQVVLRYSFDKGFLKYTEHPPDANRGFNIGPAVVSYRDYKGDRSLACAVQRAVMADGLLDECVTERYSELFLASLPTPDFSMPYNVITFTCTILALFFGRIFNLLTRDFVVLDECETEKEQAHEQEHEQNTADASN
ncbi:Subunit of the glycosylphosphatidylinositol transamidase complex-like protein [Coemansia sp. Benny D115]|nr:Subunit of the glycosylphosphatidylinositol transamidase complex-like protein [Coemansia sp. Benny D115]